MWLYLMASSGGDFILCAVWDFPMLRQYFYNWKNKDKLLLKNKALCQFIQQTSRTRDAEGTAVKKSQKRSLGGGGFPVRGCWVHLDLAQSTLQPGF